MGKIDDYMSGKEDGLLLEARIVEKDGLAGLEEEIRYRNITGIHTGLARKEAGEGHEEDQGDDAGHLHGPERCRPEGRVRIWKEEDQPVHRADEPEGGVPGGRHGDLEGLHGRYPPGSGNRPEDTKKRLKGLGEYT
ncbi:MAG: hypothetical protein ACLSFB_04825 [[Clostridium] scindens]